MSNVPRQCVIDASVLMKYLLPEAEALFVVRFIHGILDDEYGVIAVPDLFFIECANVIWKRVLRQEFDIKVAEQLLNEVEKLELTVTPVFELHTRALRLACDYQISAYDACYLALAERLGLPLLIADARLAEKTKESPLSIITITSLMGIQN